MVINVAALKDKNYDYVKEEIENVRDAIDGHTLKVIIETCYLTKEEIIKMTEICNETFVNFIKTSTGFGTKGAQLEDVELINKHKNEVLEIKASGGIKTSEDAIKFIKAGATEVFVDATHVKARANGHKMRKRIAKQEALFYEDMLKKEINEDRAAHSKKSLKDKDDDNNPSSGNGSSKEKEIKESTTDPDSGWFHKGEHKEVFAYAVETACDKQRIVYT